MEEPKRQVPAQAEVAALTVQAVLPGGPGLASGRITSTPQLPIGVDPFVRVADPAGGRTSFAAPGVDACLPALRPPRHARA